METLELETDSSETEPVLLTQAFQEENLEIEVGEKSSDNSKEEPDKEEEQEETNRDEAQEEEEELDLIGRDDEVLRRIYLRHTSPEKIRQTIRHCRL